MRSLYDDIFDGLTALDFSIPNVAVREPFDESPKVYPLIVLHEITNVPKQHGTVTGEMTTNLSYQLDIQTQACVDDNDVVLNRYAAGRRLVAEVTDYLDSTFKITRKSVTAVPVGTPDVHQFIWRGDGVLDASGYVYRQ